MAAHVGAGYAAEHAQSVHSAMMLFRRYATAGAGIDPLSAFVASRAVLGVCRALVDEPAGREKDPIALEASLNALVFGIIGQDFSVQAP